ncbi:MAG: hypothetical protein M3N48_02480 [Verrucomicrobiota bacterium]|nr:hypothetical protein [Verrucomicrobiota bacterium]
MKTDTQRYPLFSLENAVAVGAAVCEAGGSNGDVPKSVIASSLQCSSTSGAFLQRLATARSFGILEGRGAYQLTEQAKQYYLPSNDTEKQQALIGMFSSPPVFAELLKRLDGNKLPPRSIVANILRRELNLPASWSDRVAGFFVNAAQFSGALDERGFLRLAASRHALPKTSVDSRSTETPATTPLRFRPMTESAGGAVPEGKDSWVYDAVRLDTPRDMSPALWKKLNQYVSQVLKPEGAED